MDQCAEKLAQLLGITFEAARKQIIRDVDNGTLRWLLTAEGKMMGAHKGRCFRQQRRMKRRKQRQAERRYQARGRLTVGRRPVEADMFLDSLFGRPTLSRMPRCPTI